MKDNFPSPEQKLLLDLVKAGIHGHTDFEVPESTDWSKLFGLSVKQGVASISVDGFLAYVDTHPDVSLGCDSPELRRMKMKWFSRVVIDEKRYEECRNALFELGMMFSSGNIRTMLLKGYELSLNYPVPEHRNIGDIDLYHFGQWKEADALVKKMGHEVDGSHHHHTIYKFNKFEVENHYDIVNRYAHSDNGRQDDLLKSLAIPEECSDCDIDGILRPSPDFNAIFLIKHAGSHFSGEKLFIRQVLDWGLFVTKFGDKVNWDFVLDEYRRMGSWQFYCCMNAMCLDYLGFDPKLFPFFERFPKLEKRVMADTLLPRHQTSRRGVLRWLVNVWKHGMVYNESLVKTFIVLGLSHLKKAM